MIDCWETLVVIAIRKVTTVEDGIALYETRHAEAYEKLRVDFCHLIIKEPLEKVKTPATTYVTTTLSAVNTSLRSGLSTVK